MLASITPPNAPTQDSSLDAVLESMRTFPDGYWNEGSGGATIEWVDEAGSREMMTIAPDFEEKTFYLKVHAFDGRRVTETWLSLWDRARLTEVFEVTDDYFASKGLFAPAEKAAECVHCFATRGKRSSAVEWITPTDVPPEGNY